MKRQSNETEGGEPHRRLKVDFYGRVQGVGFRFTVVNLSSTFPVTGFVRNEWDGSVHLEAEGAEGDLQDFLRAIQASLLSRYIHDIQTRWSMATGEYRSFSVRYS